MSQSIAAEGSLLNLNQVFSFLKDGLRRSIVSEEQNEEYNYDEIDKEVGLGEMLKEKDSFMLTLLRKFTFGLIIIIISIVVFFASFTIGKMMFLSDNNSASKPDFQTLSEHKVSGLIPTTNITEDATKMVSGKAAPDKVEAAPVTTIAPTEAAAPAAASPQPAKPETPVVVAVPKATPKAAATVKPNVSAKSVKATIAKTVDLPPPPASKPGTALSAPIAPEVAPVVTKVTPKIKPLAAKLAATVTTPTVKPATKVVIANASGQYVVVAGTFKNPKNADQIKAALEKLSITPDMTTISRDTGSLYRLTAGVYNSLPEAKKVVDLLKSKGIESFATPVVK